jgi:hypothetical protein
VELKRKSRLEKIVYVWLFCFEVVGEKLGSLREKQFVMQRTSSIPS